MKIKNIAAICKKNKYAVIYERYGENGGVIQYIGDGAAAYPVTGLPKLDKESLLTIFDVPEKQREDWFVQVAGIPSKISFEDTDAIDRLFRKDFEAVADAARACVHRKPLSFARIRYFRRAGALRADHAARNALHRSESGLPASSSDYAI